MKSWGIETEKENPPEGIEGICRRLVTTEKIATLAEAVRALKDYVMRLLIERFHLTLKSGFNVEHLGLETADRLANAVAVYSQAAVRVMRMNYLSRCSPEAPASAEPRA